MDYVIEIKLPDALLEQVQLAARSLELSASEYLQTALREKVDRWIHHESSGEATYDQADCVLSSAVLPDELLSQSERAAADLGVSAADFLRQALQEKVSRWSQDLAHKNEMDRLTEYLLEKNSDLYRRLAEWPVAESART